MADRKHALHQGLPAYAGLQVTPAGVVANLVISAPSRHVLLTSIRPDAAEAAALILRIRFEP